MVTQGLNVGQISLNQLKASISHAVRECPINRVCWRILANAMVDNLEPIYGTFIIKVILVLSLEYIIIYSCL